LPLLLTKFRDNLATRFARERTETICRIWDDSSRLESLPAPTFLEQWLDESNLPTP
jgi:2-methylcitrate dehydratase